MNDQAAISRRELLALGAGGGMLAAAPALAQTPVSDAAVDAIVERFMAAFEIPGIGVAILRPDAPPYICGYGIRTLGRPERVDNDTLFAIASNAKSFTAAALAMLVEEGRLAWDAPLVRYLPDFAMHDPVVTQMMTVRDLLVHRSGLPLGAGDLMQFPMTDHRREEFVRALRHLPLARGFRAGYDYDNILYGVAGFLIERISGASWEDFVRARLLRPLGMRTAAPALGWVTTPNVAGRHARLGPPVRGLGLLETVAPDEGPAGAPAGGIHASVTDIVPWLSVQLGRGALPDGRRLWSEAQATEMWTPQVISIVTNGPNAENPVRPVLSGYALGWNISDYRGRRWVAHSGGLTGQVTFTDLLPEQGIGLATFANIEETLPVSRLRYALLDHLIGAAPFDWIAHTSARRAHAEAETRQAIGAGALTRPSGGPSLALARYAGRYRDPWYGDIVVARRAGGLHIDFTRTPVFKSMLEPWGDNAFRTRFPRGAGEDAVVTFALREGSVTGVTMRALSPLADFSYDFHHLAFVPVR